MALNDTDANRVRSIRLFKNVSDHRLPALLKSASIRHFPRRASLFSEGDRASCLYTLLHGSVELFSEHHDRRSTVAVIRSIKPIVLTLIVNDVNPVSACTLERTELLAVPLKVIHDLIDGDPRFARAITYELAGHLLDVIEDFKNHRLRTTIERLAEWILRCDRDAGGTGCFVLPYGKRVLASHLGMAPENLSRNLASLAALGVAVRGRQVSLSDRTALAGLARLEAPPSAPETVNTLPHYPAAQETGGRGNCPDPGEELRSRARARSFTS
jgi:CRP/FNR family transcriptional regulator, transcriptional activator FtrB